MEAEVRTLQDTAAARILRAELMAMATTIARHPGRTATLRLVRPRISEERLEEEWHAAADALRPSVLTRLSLHVLFPNGRRRVFGVSRSVPPEVDTGNEATRTGGIRLSPRDLSFAVEKLLVWAWLTRRGPLTRKWLERTTGCSYPTVASVVKRLGSAVHRHPDRRIELTHVPREEWARLFALSGEARCVMRFADRSGQPDPPAALLRRLGKIAPKGAAVGGVAGARHHHPELDLVGLPRVDLSVHAPTRDVEIGFVARLDPALEQVEDPAQPAQLVLHFVRHEDPLFTVKPGGLPWADPVECLLDLHEAGLQAQALEFLDAVTPREPAAG
jgi:hypothetical protein